MANRFLTVGDPAPWFTCRAQTTSSYSFNTVAGRYIVLSFIGSAADAQSARFLASLTSVRTRFDDLNLAFFGVSIDPADERDQRIVDSLPGVRYLWDFDRSISTQFGAVANDGEYRKISYILDPALRVVAALPFAPTPETHVAALAAIINRLPLIGPERLATLQAPVLVVPRIFEPKLCQALIDYYNRLGGQDSGFMVDVDGKTVGVLDYGHKRRRDCSIEDEPLRRACMVRIHDRLVPEIHKAFQFVATRIERYVVACYDANENGRFRPHRDNTTKATAHRRFAVSLFLNAGDYDGGFLRFPEFGPSLYSAPAGGAIVFSCSLLHEATIVTKGKRYMFLPFLYDEAARRIRDENLPPTAETKDQENSQSGELVAQSATDSAQNQ